MEGIVVSYDGTVRNSNRQLIQLRYGEDGMDGAFMEFQQLPGIKPSHASFKRRFYFDCSDQRYTNPSVVALKFYRVATFYSISNITARNT